AVELEHVGDAHAADALDDAVGVDERELQPARQLPADAALARAHEARHRHPGDDPFGRQVPARAGGLHPPQLATCSRWAARLERSSRRLSPPNFSLTALGD